MKPAIQHQERMRPSEINGCTVQNVSYLDEIDDENVLAALEKLRRTSFALSSTNQKKNQIAAAAAAATAATGASPNHTQYGPPEADAVSVVSSIINYTAGSEQRKESIKKVWNWLGMSIAQINCLSEGQGVDGITAATVVVMMKMLQVIRDGRRKRLQRLIELKKHLVKCGGGGLDDYDDTDSINDGTVGSNNDGTVETNNDENSFSVASRRSNRNANRRGNSARNNNLKMKLKYHLYRFIEAAGEILEGGIGKDDDDTLTLYGYNNNNNMLGDNSTVADTLTTIDSSLFSSFDESTIVEAPDDEIPQQKFAMAGGTESRKVANKIDPVFSMDDADGDDDGCVEVMSQQFVVIGYDPPVDDKKKTSKKKTTGENRRRKKNAA